MPQTAGIASVPTKGGGLVQGEEAQSKEAEDPVQDPTSLVGSSGPSSLPREEDICPTDHTNLRSDEGCVNTLRTIQT